LERVKVTIGSVRRCGSSERLAAAVDWAEWLAYHRLHPNEMQPFETVLQTFTGIDAETLANRESGMAVPTAMTDTFRTANGLASVSRKILTMMFNRWALTADRVPFFRDSIPTDTKFRNRSHVTIRHEREPAGQSPRRRWQSESG
jgi:hypothetical protein